MHFHGRMIAVSLLLGAAGGVGSAAGQTVIRMQPLQPAKTVTVEAAKPVADLPGDVFAPAPAGAASPGAVDPKKQERLQKIQQLTFDRRPSAILKAWATPREVALDEAA